jgi:molybdopterin converting factor small subunit
LKIQLQLFSILREALPSESKGRAVLELEEGASLVNVLEELGIKRRVVISVNSVLERDHTRQLRDGDEVKIFLSVSGG